MGEVRFTPRAERDIRDIWQAIAPENPTAAEALVSRFFAKLAQAAGFPQMGSPRPELSETARLLFVSRYVIIYEPMPYGVLAVAIVHGMREPESWL